MKYSYALLSMIMFGLIGLVFIYMFESITINNESEYYTLKEAMEASMIESIDIACFRNSSSGGCNGKLKIVEQKFVENFAKRFSNSVIGDYDKYVIEFYDIMESPPKATVVIRESKDYNVQRENSISIDGTLGTNVVNNLTGILEMDKEWIRENVTEGTAYDYEDSSGTYYADSNSEVNNHDDDSSTNSRDDDEIVEDDTVYDDVGDDENDEDELGDDGENEEDEENSEEEEDFDDE